MSAMSSGKGSVDGVGFIESQTITIIDEEEEEEETDGDVEDDVVTNKQRELDAQSEATMDNPYLQHLMGNHRGAVKMHGAHHGAEASITLTNGTNGMAPPLTVPVDDVIEHRPDISGGDSVYGPGPGSPDNGNVTGHDRETKNVDHPKPAYYVVAADGDQFGHGLSPRFEKLKWSRARGRSSKSRRSSKRSSRRSTSRRSQKSDHLSPSPRGRGISNLSEAVSELSDITATTLNTDSDTAEGSEDGVQPMTYPTDGDSMGFTTSSSDRDSEPEPIAKKLQHRDGFHAVSAGHRHNDHLSDITSMDGDHDFETTH